MKELEITAGIIVKNNKVLIGQRKFHDKFGGKWEFPGGKIEKGETPEEAIRREIREELEVEIEVGPLLGTIEYDYPNFHLSMDTFLAKVREGTIVLKEAEAAKWLTKSSLDTVGWLPADQTIIKKIHEIME